MAILIKLLAAGLDIGAVIGVEGIVLGGGIALAAAFGGRMVRPRRAIAA
ncbi:MAG: hypothetical protein PGN09_05355 [Sphingomonas fennica]